MKEKYRIKTTPKAKKENIILGKYYRITFLTEQLVRFEYNEEGEFEDHATQIILNRDFEKVDYSKFNIIISTEDIKFETETPVIYQNEILDKMYLKKEIFSNTMAIKNYGLGFSEKVLLTRNLTTENI